MDVHTRPNTRSTRWGQLTCLAVFLTLTGCRAEVVGPRSAADAHFAKTDPCDTSAPGKGKRCDSPPEPLPDHHLPPVASDAMTAPLRLHWSPGDWLLASDPSESMVFRVDPATLLPVEGFPTRGKPLGVTALEGSIYVGNADRRTIDVHRTDGGGFTASFGPGIVERPADLAADPNEGLVFALDGARREVRVFSRWGTMTTRISGPGTGPGLLENPTAIGLDPVRKWVMVSDYGSADGGDASLKIFDYDGSLVHEVSGAGSCGMLGCRGGFSRPQGASVDATGLIYLPDALLAQVLVIDPSNWSMGTPIGERGFLRLPTDVVFDDFGDLYVASNRTGAIRAVRGVGAQ